MQLMPRYLVSNRTFLIVDESGFVVEYNPVYKRQLQLYKGIENTLEFQLLNADQKPINLNRHRYYNDRTESYEYKIRFTAFDDENNMVMQKDGDILLMDDSSPSRGIFRVVITENDMLNLKDQYLTYNVVFYDEAGQTSLTYADTNFGMNGVIKLSSEAFPGPKPTHSIKEFKPLNSDPQQKVWYSEPVTAQPGQNGNSALHTAVVYTDGYIGDVDVEATLENQIDGTDHVNWATIDTLSFDGSSEVEPVPINFKGVFGFIRFRTNADPSTIPKILVRN